MLKCVRQHVFVMCGVCVICGGGKCTRAGFRPGDPLEVKQGRVLEAPSYPTQWSGCSLFDRDGHGYWGYHLR